MGTRSVIRRKVILIITGETNTALLRGFLAPAAIPGDAPLEMETARLVPVLRAGLVGAARSVEP